MDNIVRHSSERFKVAIILTMVGGFLDIYTFMFRGEVFANAITGNLVLFGLHLSKLEWLLCGKYVVAIMAYGLGIIVAEFVHHKAPKTTLLSWHQWVIVLELAWLLPIPFIPYSTQDHFVTVIISFVCALQVQTFRKVRGLPFASTMCTGNLRFGSEALYNFIGNRGRKEALIEALHYYAIIIFFVLGVALGAILFRLFGHYIVFLAPAALLYVLFLIRKN